MRSVLFLLLMASASISRADYDYFGDLAERGYDTFLIVRITSGHVEYWSKLRGSQGACFNSYDAEVVDSVGLTSREKHIAISTESALAVSGSYLIFYPASEYGRYRSTTLFAESRQAADCARKMKGIFLDYSEIAEIISVVGSAERLLDYVAFEDPFASKIPEQQPVGARPGVRVGSVWNKIKAIVGKKGRSERSGLDN